MFPRTVKRAAGVVVAAVTLSLVASVAPATAAPPSFHVAKTELIAKPMKDSGWG